MNPDFGNRCNTTFKLVLKEKYQWNRNKKDVLPILNSQSCFWKYREQKNLNGNRQPVSGSPGQIRNWKSIATRGLTELFSTRKKESDLQKEKQIHDLCRQVDQLQRELNWLRGNLDLNHKDRVSLIDRQSLGIAVCRQAELLGVSRSSVYYQRGRFAGYQLFGIKAQSHGVV